MQSMPFAQKLYTCVREGLCVCMSSHVAKVYGVSIYSWVLTVPVFFSAGPALSPATTIPTRSSSHVALPSLDMRSECSKAINGVAGPHEKTLGMYAGIVKLHAGHPYKQPCPSGSCVNTCMHAYTYVHEPCSNQHPLWLC